MRAMLLNSKVVDVDPVHQLELIDTLQRLGVSYHFQEEIKSVLNFIYNENKSSYRDKQQTQESLYAVALQFGLLRKHDFDIPTSMCIFEKLNIQIIKLPNVFSFQPINFLSFYFFKKILSTSLLLYYNPNVCTCCRSFF